MATKKDWLLKKADDAATAEPPVRPLDEVDAPRQAPEAQPTAAPQPAEPIPMNELLKQFENAAHSLHDAGMDLEKANVAIRKITASGGRTPAEQAVISKAEALISQMDSAHETVRKLADEITQFRSGLGDGKSSGLRSSWIA